MVESQYVAEFDVVIVGGGVVGLAIARASALAGWNTLLLEREPQFGEHASSRSSEVLHAGFYYPPKSQKAKHCVRGRRLLIDFMNTRKIPYRLIGKWVLATHENQVEQLETLVKRGALNDAPLLEMMDQKYFKRMEPQLHAVAALSSPQTGIFNSHILLRQLVREARDADATLLCRTTVEAIEALNDDSYVLSVSGVDSFKVKSKAVVNSAGLFAPDLVQRCNFDQPSLPTARFAKGNYFRLGVMAPSERLVYPIPEQGGLGIHLTHDLAGGARFGPDVEWIDSPNYKINETRQTYFEQAIREYWPSLPSGVLYPDYAGIRAKLTGVEQPQDFMILGPQTLARAGLIHLFGIESPGLTACLSIAESVCELLKE